MDNIITSAAELMMQNVRHGTVLTPPELKRTLGNLETQVPLTEHALAIRVPNWLVSAFERQLRAPSLGFSVYPTLDRADKVLAVTLQCENTQLRLAMMLSEPAIQAFLAESLPARRLCFVLDIEHTTLSAAMAAPLSADESHWLMEHTAGARPSPLGIAPAIQLAALHVHPDLVPSLLNGSSVADVISSFVTSRPRVDVATAVLAAVAPDKDEVTRHTRH